MSTMEIILIIAGVVVLVVGYFVPAGKKKLDEEVQLISEDEIRKLIAKETDEVHDRVAKTVDEGIKYAMENTERSMEKVSNEKIMAINEYSDTVLEEINKNHQEVVFLYDMLNDKHDNLVNTISEMTTKAEGITQTVRDAEITAKEGQSAVQDMTAQVEAALEEAQEMIGRLQQEEQSVRDAQNNLEISMGRLQSMLSEVEKRQQEVGAAKPAEEVSALPEPVKEEPVKEEQEDTFRPIAAKRVEIIHEPDGDYVAPTEAAIQPDEPKPAKKPRKRPAKKKEEEQPEKRQMAGQPAEAAEMDIQFAQGKESGRNSNERILELHKAGKSNMAIAKELGLGIGEVKLVIDLFEGM